MKKLIIILILFVGSNCWAQDTTHKGFEGSGSMNHIEFYDGDTFTQDTAFIIKRNNKKGIFLNGEGRVVAILDSLTYYEKQYKLYISKYTNSRNFKEINRYVDSAIRYRTLKDRLTFKK